MADSIDASNNTAIAVEKTAAGPRQFDLDRCVHCGLCLNSCPTYRVLGLEMDSPRGRVYQMVQVANGAPMTPAYFEHIGLCLACRGCESACPSGVQYGRMVEEARAEIETHTRRGPLVGWLRRWAFGTLLESRVAMTAAGAALYLYEVCGARALVHSLGLARLFGLHDLHQLTPSADPPFFFSRIGQTFPAEGERRYRVAFLAGCLANVFFARLNEASVRVLQKNGCEVVIPAGQGCCGALQLHSGLPEIARTAARRNIDALRAGGFDAIITNAAGCGSTLKEYGELLAGDAEYASAAGEFAHQVRDITEFLAGIDLHPAENPVHATVTYQDSCHLAHGQRIRSAPRKLLAAIPGVTLREMSGADLCCGSAGVYNIVQNEMSMRILAAKMDAVHATGADIIATANPGCMLQLQAGVKSHKGTQEVVHVIELLDRAYRGPVASPAGEKQFTRQAEFLRESSGSTNIQKTLLKALKVLKLFNIPHYVCGGFAVQEHGYPRFTADVDIIVPDVRFARQKLEGNGFQAAPSKMTVTDRESGVEIDVLPGGGKVGPGPVSFPMPTKVSDEPQILALHELLSLKLSSYLGSPIDSAQDYADAIKLIQVNNPGREFGVDPSVRELYLTLWDRIHTKKS